jgi:hypothetical protein
MIQFSGPEPVQEVLAHHPCCLQGIAYGRQPVFQRSPGFRRKVIQIGFQRFRIQGRGLPGQLIQVRDKGVDGVGAKSPSASSACPASSGLCWPGGIAVFGKFNDIFGHISAPGGFILVVMEKTACIPPVSGGLLQNCCFPHPARHSRRMMGVPFIYK